MIGAAVFYLFALALIFSASLTVTARQPVHAVLFLIWSFFNAAGLFLTLGAEFLAFILLIVYIGAVAVLFLFVVMMLNMKGDPLSGRFKKALPLGLTLGAALLAQMAVVVWQWPAQEAAAKPEGIENIHALGRVLYTDYFYVFQVSGLVLLVAMIGAIVLTLRPRRAVKRQDVWAQLDRNREDVIEVRKVKIGEGA